MSYASDHLSLQELLVPQQLLKEKRLHREESKVLKSSVTGATRHCSYIHHYQASPASFRKATRTCLTLTTAPEQVQN